MNDELLKDLKTLVQRHEQVPIPRPSITRWVPICEGYVDAKWAELCEERGGNTVQRGKNGMTVKVLAWVKVRVAFDSPISSVQILDQLTAQPY